MTNSQIKTLNGFLKPLGFFNRQIFGKNFHQRVILAYHGISKQPSYNCVALELLRDHLAWLREHYSVVSLSELVADLHSEQSCSKNLVALTVDDGYENFFDFALPLLAEYQCHATVFVPSGKVGYYNDWDEGMPHFQKMPIMTYQTLRDLPAEYVEIGSHGASHVAFNKLTSDEVAKEIRESRLILQDNIGRAVNLIAFPFGVYPFGRRFQFYQWGKKLLEPYRAACTTWWGRFNSIEHVYALRRISIWDTDSFDDFQNKLRGQYDWLCGKEKLGRTYKWVKSFLI